ncbi:hypothetical protein [Horticoccus sp. 23ND18S-11]|uniref:hypothetical protein n=1 Tax=Horticoccus sp. 23ND18S-11 TaxID=3391832 RepID=UPI0039C99344
MSDVDMNGLMIVGVEEEDEAVSFEDLWHFATVLGHLATSTIAILESQRIATHPHPAQDLRCGDRFLPNVKDEPHQ